MTQSEREEQTGGNDGKDKPTSQIEGLGASEEPVVEGVKRTEKKDAKMEEEDVKQNFAAQVNELTFAELRARLQDLNLKYDGNKKDLKKRLKYQLEKQAGIHNPTPDSVVSNHTTKPSLSVQKIQRKKVGMHKQPFDYYLALDFEATCEENDYSYNHEIIEFPVVCINSMTLEVEGEFHRFLKPRVNPTLTEFCINLTGITQEQVDKGIDFKECMQELREWMAERGLGTTYTYSFITDGPCDFKRFLVNQCKLSGMAYPSECCYWVDIKRTFRSCLKRKPYTLTLMLCDLGLAFEGRQHSGLQDARNIGYLAMALVKKGYVLLINRDVRPQVTGGSTSTLH